MKSVRIWQKPEGDHWTKGECQCPNNSGQSQEKRDVEPIDRDDSVSAGNVASSYPMAPADAESTLRFMMAATVINSLVLLAAMAVWGTSLCRGRCSACAAAGSGSHGKVGSGAGYRLAGSADPTGEGRGEVEVMGSSRLDSVRRHVTLGER